jgi:hypothetical protein
MAKRTKRTILTVGVGAVITAVEGLACGNPVEPSRYRDPMPKVEEPRPDAGTMLIASDADSPKP